MAHRWTTAEDELLRRGYETGVAVNAIAGELRRSADAVDSRRRSLTIPPRRAPPSWRALEDELLRCATLASLPATLVAERLHRPVDQVRARRRVLGLTRPRSRRYSAEDDDLLRRHWTSGGDLVEFARRLGRSPDSLRLRADQLGFHRPCRRPRWNAAEDNTLRDGYANGETCRETARTLPGRSPGAVSARALKLGLATYARRWSASDDGRLRALLGASSLEQTAGALGRTPEGVRRRARQLGIPISATVPSARAGARWSEHEDDLLRMQASVNPASLAALLGRSDRAVASRLRHLGLRVGRERSPHHPASGRGGLTPGERQLLARQLDRGSHHGLVVLAGRFDLPPKTVRELVRSSDTGFRQGRQV